MNNEVPQPHHDDELEAEEEEDVEEDVTSSDASMNQLPGNESAPQHQHQMQGLPPEGQPLDVVSNQMHGPPGAAQEPVANGAAAVDAGRAAAETGKFQEALIKMLEQCPSVVRWDSLQGSLHVINPVKLQQEVLPRFFRTSRYESFLRQLHIYCFRKVEGKGRWKPAIYSHAHLKGKSMHSIMNLRPRARMGKVLGKSRQLDGHRHQDPRPAEMATPSMSGLPGGYPGAALQQHWPYSLPHPGSDASRMSSMHKGHPGMPTGSPYILPYGSYGASMMARGAMPGADQHMQMNPHHMNPYLSDAGQHGQMVPPPYYYPQLQAMQQQRDREQQPAAESNVSGGATTNSGGTAGVNTAGNSTETPQEYRQQAQPVGGGMEGGAWVQQPSPSGEMSSPLPIPQMQGSAVWGSASPMDMQMGAGGYPYRMQYPSYYHPQYQISPQSMMSQQGGMMPGGSYAPNQMQSMPQSSQQQPSQMSSDGSGMQHQTYSSMMPTMSGMMQPAFFNPSQLLGVTGVAGGVGGTVGGGGGGPQLAQESAQEARSGTGTGQRQSPEADAQQQSSQEGQQNPSSAASVNSSLGTTAPLPTYAMPIDGYGYGSYPPAYTTYAPAEASPTKQDKTPSASSANGTTNGEYSES